MKTLTFIFLLITLQVSSQSIYFNMGRKSDAKPTVTNFVIPATGNDLIVPISTFTATDDKAVVGYKITASSTAPSYSSSGWTATPPATYTFTTFGNKTLYAWAKDATGHVSSYKSDAITLTQIDNTPPAITSFVIPPTATSLTIAINVFTATDNVGVTGYAITETNVAPTSWAGTAPTTYTFATEGAKTLYAWVRDAANNASTAATDQCEITLPDITKPIVNTFTIPATSASLTISITQFTASDNKGVTGYALTETNSEPISGWTATAPTTYTFDSFGSKTLYAWAKDAAGNISLSLSDAIVIGMGYYVSNDGNDSNTGLSPNTPIKTIAKVNTLNLSGAINDVYLKKGDVFDDATLTVGYSGTAGNNITIGAYGSGPKPVILGDIIRGEFEYIIIKNIDIANSLITNEGDLITEENSENYLKEEM